MWGQDSLREPEAALALSRWPPLIPATPQRLLTSSLQQKQPQVTPSSTSNLLSIAQPASVGV